MHSFLSDNREALIARCEAKVAHRPTRAATPRQLAIGVPLFLEQLTNTLHAEEQGNAAEGERIQPAAPGAVARW